MTQTRKMKANLNIKRQLSSFYEILNKKSIFWSKMLKVLTLIIMFIYNFH